MAALRMFRATNVFRSALAGPFRSNGSRLLSTAAQTIDSDDSGGEFPEVDELGVTKIVEALKEQRQVDEAMQPWKGLVGYQTVSKVLEQVGSGSTALSFFEWAGRQERFGRHRIGSYRLLVQKLTAGGMGKEIRNVLLEMHEHGYFLRKRVFMDVIEQLLKLKKSEDVVGIVEIMLDVRWVSLVADVVETCCEAGDTDIACSTLELIASKNVTFPKDDGLTKLVALVISKADDRGWMLLDKVLKKDTEYYMLVGLLCKQQQVELACNVLDKMVEAGVGPTMLSFTRIADGLVKASKLREALALLDVMVEYGYQPDVVIYNHILDGLCKTGKVKKAFKLLKIMTESGCSPNSYTCSALINGLCLQGKTAKARAVLEKMIKGGFVPDVVTYTILINRLRKDGDVTAAVDLLRTMVSRGCSPDRATYVCLIAGLCKEKDVEAVREFVEEHKHRFEMDIKIYNMLISTYGKNGMLQEAQELYEDMKKRGLAPSLIVVNSIMSAMCQRGQVDEAMGFYKHMPGELVPDLYTYTILMGGLCDLGRTEEACALKDTMQEKNCKPDKVTYGVLVAGLIRAGKYREAEVVKKEMAAANFPAS